MSARNTSLAAWVRELVRTELSKFRRALSGRFWRRVEITSSGPRAEIRFRVNANEVVQGGTAGGEDPSAAIVYDVSPTDNNVDSGFRFLSPDGSTTAVQKLPTPSAAGDVAVYDGNDWTLLAVGSDDDVLTADSSVSKGVKWAALTGLPTPSAAGDLAVWNGSAWVIQAVGADDQVLTADSAEADGVKWAAVSVTNALLDNSNHTDTAAATVSRGSIIYGDSTPEWNELTIGAADTLLGSDGTDVAWKSRIALAATSGDEPSLALTAGAAPGTEANGDIWHDSTQKALASYLDGIRGWHSRALYCQQTDKTVASTSTETDLVDTTSAIGTVTLPADFFVVGKAIRLIAAGQIQRATGSWVMRLRLGGVSGTAVCTTGTVGQSITGTMPWGAELVCYCRSVGASGSVLATGAVEHNDGSATGSIDRYRLQNGSGAVTVDTTSSQAVALTWDWGTSHASNSITINSLLIQELF